MRKLDLIGMILTIIGVNVLLITGAIFIITPEYVIRVFVPFLNLTYIACITGVSIIIIGLIIRLFDWVTKDKKYERNSEFQMKRAEIADKIINYLRINQGKAFTANALITRIDWEKNFEVNQRFIERLLHNLVISNVIKSELNNGEKFYTYQ